MKKLQTLILLSFFSAAVYAQGNEFLLYSFKGNVSVVENNVESKARIGKMLAPGATVKVASGSMVTLICNEASMFTISKTGSYPLSRLGDSCQAVGNSVSSNYVKYVWNQMTKSSGSPGSNRKQYMSTVGAVSRNINNIWIDNRLDTLNYSGGEFFLSWKSYAEAREFEFFLYPADNIYSPLFKTNVDKLKISLLQFAKKMKPGQSYYWTAAVKGEENEEMKLLNYVTPETYKALLNSFRDQGPAYEGPAEQAYRIAFMLEDAHYLAEAYSHYTKAAELDPTNPMYRATLMSFKKDYEIK